MIFINSQIMILWDVENKPIERMITCCLKAYVIEPNEKGIFITTPTKIDKKTFIIGTHNR